MLYQCGVCLLKTRQHSLDEVPICCDNEMTPMPTKPRFSQTRREPMNHTLTREEALKYAPVVEKSIELLNAEPKRTYASIVWTAGKECNVTSIPTEVCDAICLILFHISVTRKLPGTPDAG